MEPKLQFKRTASAWLVAILGGVLIWGIFKATPPVDRVGPFWWIVLLFAGMVVFGILVGLPPKQEDQSPKKTVSR